MTEIWKDIEGYEGRYQVSNLGQVKSLSRLVNTRGGQRRMKESILRPIRTKAGYCVVNFVWPKRTQFLVHRLVAKAHCDRLRPDQEHINHKDFNKANNSADNLEWCNPQENIIHSCIGDRNGRIILDKQTGIFYYSVSEAAEAINWRFAVSTLQRRLKANRRTGTSLRYC